MNRNPIYFYCTRNPAEPERGNPETILRSLVRQLSNQPPDGALLDPVQNTYQAREKDGFAAGPLTIEESTNLIIELCHKRQLTTIVVDALDECEPVLREELLSAFNDILQASEGLVKILVSSRNERDIVCHLEGCINLEIQASNNQADIVHFVRTELDTLIQNKALLSGRVSRKLRQEMELILCEGASGM